VAAIAETPAGSGFSAVLDVLGGAGRIAEKERVCGRGHVCRTTTYLVQGRTMATSATIEKAPGQAWVSRRSLQEQLNRGSGADHPSVLSLTADNDSGVRPTRVPSPGARRQYAVGQLVEVRSDNGQWRSARVIDFGNQDTLPAYWVRIDGWSDEALKFEFEMRLRRDHRSCCVVMDERADHVLS